MALSEIVFILGHHLGQAPGALFLKFKAIPGRTSVQSCVDFRFYPFLWVFFFFSFDYQCKQHSLRLSIIYCKACLFASFSYSLPA